MTLKMALEIINLAATKYEAAGQNAIIAVKRHASKEIVLTKEVFDTVAELRKAIFNWEKAGFGVYTTKI